MTGNARHARALVTVAASLVALATAGGAPLADEQTEGSQTDPHAKHRQMAMHNAEAGGDSMTLDIPSAAMLTQYGQPVDLRSEVVADRIVVMDFVYTTCTTVCPVLSAILSQVRGKLAERLGNDVVLVSMTVDPKRDTPARLKKYSANFRADDGWLWLTGDKPTVDEVLRALGVYTANFEDHPPTVLVGDGETGRWSRFVGFPAADAIVNKVEQLSRARQERAASGG